MCGRCGPWPHLDCVYPAGPFASLPIGALTEADRELLAWGLGQDVDYVALSFVRCADDVRELKELIAAAGGDHHRVAMSGRREPAVR